MYVVKSLIILSVVLVSILFVIYRRDKIFLEYGGLDIVVEGFSKFWVMFDSWYFFF